MFDEHVVKITMLIEWDKGLGSSQHANLNRILKTSDCVKTNSLFTIYIIYIKLIVSTFLIVKLTL